MSKVTDPLLDLALRTLADRGAAPVATLAAHRLIYQGEREPFQQLVQQAVTQDDEDAHPAEGTP